MARVMTGASWRQTLELLSAARDITVEDFDQNDPSMLLATLDIGGHRLTVVARHDEHAYKGLALVSMTTRVEEGRAQFAFRRDQMSDLDVDCILELLTLEALVRNALLA